MTPSFRCDTTPEPVPVGRLSFDELVRRIPFDALVRGMLKLPRAEREQFLAVHRHRLGRGDFFWPSAL